MGLDEKPTIPRVSRTSLVDEVIAAMKKMLSKDLWPAGSKLPSEQQLARELGVGRSTIRESLRVLEHLGLIESKTGLGTYVVERGMPEGWFEYPKTPETLQELYEFRRAIEVPAAHLAAERRTPSQLKVIKAAWAKCEVAVKNDSPDEFANLDFYFHLAIIEATRNRFFVDAYRPLENAFGGYVNLILSLGPLRNMLHFHDDLIEAIERSDPVAAVAAVQQNFVETDVRRRLIQPTDKSHRRANTQKI